MSVKGFSLGGWPNAGTGSPGSGHTIKPARVQGVWHMVGLLGSPVQRQELDLMTLKGPFQLSIFSLL